MATKWRRRGLDSATAPALPRNQPETAKLAAKKPQPASRSAELLRKHWNNCRFLSIMGLMESSRLGRRICRRERRAFDWNGTMSSLKVTLGILAAGFMLSGCIQGTTYEATNTQ